MDLLELKSLAKSKSLDFDYEDNGIYFRVVVSPITDKFEPNGDCYQWSGPLVLFHTFVDRIRDFIESNGEDCIEISRSTFDRLTTVILSQVNGRERECSLCGCKIETGELSKRIEVEGLHIPDSIFMCHSFCTDIAKEFGFFTDLIGLNRVKRFEGLIDYYHKLISHRYKDRDLSLSKKIENIWCHFIKPF